MLAVIVMDCAEHTILRELAAAGRAPTLATLMQRGTTIPLRSDGGEMDGAVFQTLLTGTNPGKHGIHKYRQLVPGTYRYALSKASESPLPQIWRVLSERGRRCCVFDVPKAFAMENFNGALIGAWGAYSPAGSPCSSPADLFGRMTQRFGRHPQPTQRPLPLSPRGYATVLDNLLEGVRRRLDICRWLLAEGPFDFFMTAFSESHVGCHEFWHLQDPRHFLYDRASAEACGDAMQRIYQAIDAAVGDLLATLGDDATVVLMTQQGVQHNHTGSHLLPAWLARRAGLEYRTPGLFKLTDKLGSRVRVGLKKLLPEKLTDVLVQRKDPPRGDVFALPGSEYSALLRVNLQGREPAGTVPAKAYRETIEAQRDDLLMLLNPATGAPALREVMLTHDIYHGPCLEQLPDMIVGWKNDCPIESLHCPTHGTISDGVKVTDMTYSMHTGEGMAVIAGPGVQHASLDTVHELPDLTASFYALLGESPPDWLDGEAIALGCDRSTIRG